MPDRSIPLAPVPEPSDARRPFLQIASIVWTLFVLALAFYFAKSAHDANSALARLNALTAETENKLRSTMQKLDDSDKRIANNISVATVLNDPEKTKQILIYVDKFKDGAELLRRIGAFDDRVTGIENARTADLQRLVHWYAIVAVTFQQLASDLAPLVSGAEAKSVQTSAERWMGLRGRLVAPTTTQPFDP